LHGQSDARTAQKFAFELIKRGVESWVDQPNPAGIEPDPQAKQAALAEGMASADKIVVFISATCQSSPDWVSQLTAAHALDKPLFGITRKGTYIQKPYAAKLANAPQTDYESLNFEAALPDIMAMLGLDNLAVNDLVSELDVEQWLPGLWSNKFYNPRNAMIGWSEFEFLAKKKEAQGIVRSEGENGEWFMMQVSGNWQLRHNRLVISGVARIAMFIQEATMPKQMGYTLVLNLLDISRDRIRGYSTIGDRVLWTRKSGAN
jgi:hypothetical protein